MSDPAVEKRIRGQIVSFIVEISKTIWNSILLENYQGEKKR